MDWSLPTSLSLFFSLMETPQTPGPKRWYYKLCSTASCYYNTIMYRYYHVPMIIMLEQKNSMVTSTWKILGA